MNYIIYSILLGCISNLTKRIYSFPRGLTPIQPTGISSAPLCSAQSERTNQSLGQRSECESRYLLNRRSSPISSALFLKSALSTNDRSVLKADNRRYYWCLMIVPGRLARLNGLSPQCPRHVAASLIIYAVFTMYMRYT
jgi:hypothetical protein